VVIVPRDVNEYARLFTAGMMLRNIGYFLSLQDREPFARPERNRQIRIILPAANVLTVATLRRLIDPEATGREL
jgi:hypothetical protein